MKRHIKNISYIILLNTMIFLLSCSDDDPSPTLNVTKFSTTVDENQIVDVVLGSVIAKGTDGPFIYNITNQSPNGSIAINQATGEITVADASAFDFETNPKIIANMSVKGNSITETSTITISLNDIDDIAFFLTDSKIAYSDAKDGDWIQVTETEYNDLSSKLNKVIRIGTTEAQYTATRLQGRSLAAFTVANNAGANAPANSYIFAFKYFINYDHFINVGGIGDINGAKVKQSENVNSYYNDLGSPLPAHSGSEKNVFFVLKGNSVKLNLVGYIAFYKPIEVNMGTTDNDQNFYINSGDVNSDFGLNFPGYYHYQGLSTTQKQW